jgi:cytosine/adenosine deaminase-related metal-dependent hydrolase
MPDSHTTAFRARWVFPIEGPPLENGVVVCRQGRIATVGRGTSDQVVASPLVDLGDSAILPGLVNAHTHLELSDVAEPLGYPGIRLPQWIPRVIEHRRRRGDSGASAVAAGWRESLRHGVTCLADIASLDALDVPDLVQPPRGRMSANADAAGSPALPAPQSIAFLEWIGLSAAVAAERLAAIAEWLARSRGSGTAAGISPHAPYSVRYDALPHAIELSRTQRVPLAMHLAESPEELQLLRQGTGPLRDMLRELGVWDPTALPERSAPGDYLRWLATAHRALVIHGNYLTDDDFTLLARHRDKLSVVFCPRTHAYFGHDDYPLQRMLAAGVRVALGTDSRASSPDLDLLAEARRVAGCGLASPAQAVRMATLAGAEALGRGALCGSLVPGKRADLCVLSVRASAAADPYELLVETDAAVRCVVIGGVAWRGSDDCPVPQPPGCGSD